jgi:hypothetical protein
MFTKDGCKIRNITSCVVGDGICDCCDGSGKTDEDSDVRNYF